MEVHEMASATLSPQPEDSRAAFPPGALYLDDKSRFEAAKACYQQQTLLLTTMTKVDMQIISGYLATQFIIAGWTTKEMLGSMAVRLGLSLIEVVLTTAAYGAFWNSKTRRGEVSEVVRNLNRVLGYSVKGAYLEDVVVQREFKTHYWFPWHVAAMVGSVVGVGFVLWWPR
jgi:hypothetical protein